MKLTRTYTLKLYGNFHKMEAVRYTTSRYKLYLQSFTNYFYFHPWVDHTSTKGMGLAANQAQKEAKGIIKAGTEAFKATGHKFNLPEIKEDVCPAKIQKNKVSSFDYWAMIPDPLGDTKSIYIPALSHRKLNDKIRNNWKLSDYCELFQKESKWYVRVFVTKEVQTPEVESKSLGIDVGIKHVSARSDGYLGPNLGKIINKEKKAQAERSRQHHKKKSFKTLVKQQLNVEVNRALTRCKYDGLSLVVENPKILANLTRCSNRWARSYFANRATVRAIEEGVWITYVHPAYTSITCSKCGIIDKQSRVNQCTFKCTSCKSEFNADLNAAKNIALKGQERLIHGGLVDKAPVNLKGD